MAVTSHNSAFAPVHPIFAFLLSGAVPLFLGAWLSDLAYGASAEPQWSNFAAWLLVGAMIFAGFAWLWSLVALIRAGPRPVWLWLCFVLLLAALLLGLIDSFVHARDAWGVMPAATIFSALVTLAALLAAAIGLSGLRQRDTK